MPKNVFQFKSFRERIAEIDIRRSALYYVGHDNEKLENDHAHFHEAVQRWCALNLTGEFQEYMIPIRAIVTLPQLLHHKTFVVQHLMCCLEKASGPCLQALLDILVALAKDLRAEFCPYFFNFFDRLILLFDSADSDNLENTCLCLAFLLKTLRGFLRKNIEQIFQRLVHLLEDSKPVHVTNFATECFGFLARDITNKKELIYLISIAVASNSCISTGCGRLLFEIMRGVNGQFHSCAEQYWKLLLVEVINEKPNKETGFEPQCLYDVLLQTVTDALHCIEPDNMKPFWTAIHLALENHLANGSILNETAFHYVLQLVGVTVEYQHGNCLQNVPFLIGKLVRAIGVTESDAILLTISKIATIMLLSKNRSITLLEVSRLTKNIMTIGSRSRNVFEEFTLNVVESAMFEVLVLPDYLKYLEQNFDSGSLQLLMKIIMRKSHPCKNGIDLNEWEPFPINLRCNKALMKILQIIEGSHQVGNRNNFFACIIVLPHLKDFKVDNRILHAIENELYSTLANIEANSENCSNHELELLIETLIHLNISETRLFLEITKRLLPVIKSNRKEPLINVVSMCLVHMSKQKPELLDDCLFNIVHAHLCAFLSSLYPQTRLLVTHSFTLFSKCTSFALNCENGTLFDILFSIQSVQPNIHYYKEQVVLLKKIEFDTKLFQSINNPEFRIDAMRVVMSLLSINFSLLWKPVSEVLQTYAERFSVTDFWNVYKQQLICKQVINDTPSSRIFLEQNNGFEMHPNKLQNDQCEKIDFVNYRIQLLTSLSKFGSIVDARNRDIVDLFFQFIEEEYRCRKLNANKANDYVQKNLQRILIAYLNIFSGARDLKRFYKAQKLYQIFLECLNHRSIEIQRLSLDCIFTYKNPAILPYRENLYRLNCNKSFKQEMTTFFKKGIDEENELRCIVQDEHQAEVIPLVIKIVHTKMLQKTTPPEVKQNVLRFIGNFREQEIMQFINMSFDCFEKLLQTHAMETYNYIVSSNQNFDDLTFHHLQVLISLIENIFEEFAALKSENFKRYLLHIKFCMDAILLQMEHSLVKQLKSQATLNVVNFFNHFDNYKWSEEEIEAVFYIYVWPQINNLENDCIHSPTPLFKLLSAWSKTPRYFSLLVKLNQSPSLVISCTPIEKIMSLLSSGKASDIVCREICTMINSMLLMDSTDIENTYVLPVGNTSISNKQDSNKHQNIGCLILSPYFLEILCYIQKLMKQNRSISKDLLNILSYVSEYAKDTTLCDALSDMLFPMTIRKTLLPNVDPEAIQKMHQVLYTLLKSVSHPDKYRRQVGLLLERVNDLVARKTVCRMIDLLVEKCDDPQLAQYASILHDMNAMDKRWLGQPNFSRRLNAFRKLEELTKQHELVSVEFVIWIVHQCFYYLRTDHDLAIRDNTYHYLRTTTIDCIKMHYSDKRESVQYLIERVILPALIKGVKNTNETVRYESINLIGELSCQCSDYHSVFADLHLFTNKSDREIDFFENVTHLQAHRHRRALKHFYQIVKTSKKTLSVRTLVDFVLPIVSIYLCNETYRKKAKLIEAAVKCVTLVGRMLPWSSYKTLLKHYLNKMKHDIEYQKQIIKIVTGLLDNFHYDLNKLNVSGASTQLFESNTIAEKKSTKIQINVNDTTDGEEENDVSNMPSLKENNTELIIEDIMNDLIPDLLSAINYKEMKNTIKLNERKERHTREKRDMLKIPLAITIVKLLQKLPDCMLEQNLPKLFIRVINFLKSSLKQVHNTARETLKCMLVAVGPQFLKIVLDDLSAILKHGFQVRVRITVIHSLLDALQDRINAVIVDDILQLVLNMCICDIFGLSSDGHDVGFSAGKTPEGKHSKKSFSILYMLAKNMGEKSTLDLIIPLKEIINKTNSKKTVVKAQEALQKIADGICCNSNISVESSLILIYGITSENIPDLSCNKQKNTTTGEQKAHIKRKCQDIHLIPVEPKREGVANQSIITSGSNSNSYVFVEMGLEVLHMLVRKNRIILEHEQFIEPLIPILIDAMNSSHIRTITLSVKCLASLWSNKIEVSCVVKPVHIVVENLLNILHKYAASEIGGTDENFHLIKCCFKAMVTLMKFVKYHQISTAQLKMLLLYVERNLMYSDRQHMAIILLRSIVGRKLVSEEMVSVMKKVAELSVMNDNEKLRGECRRVVLDYLVGYPLGSNVEHTINFYVSQLEYEVLSGRESSVLMLQAIFKSFPAELLTKKGNYLFYALGIRLINEKSVNCRILVAKGLETLLAVLTRNQRDDIANLVIIMMNETKLSERELAAQFLMRIINVEKETFMLRAEKIIPALLNSMTTLSSESTGKFVRLKQIESQDYGEEFQDLKDHSLYQILNVFSKLFEVCPEVVTDEKYANMMDDLAYSVQSLLSYGHQWVRYVSLQLIGAFLVGIDPKVVIAVLNGKQCTAKQQFIYHNPTEEIRSLVLDMCSQLSPGQTDEQTAYLIAKNFVLLCYIIADVPLDSKNNKNNKEINLNWIVRRIRYVIQSEVSKSPKTITIRKNMLDLFDSIIDLINSDVMLVMAPSIMSPLLRELNDQEHLDENIKVKIEPLMRKIKSKIGIERYDAICLGIKAKIEEKRRARSLSRAVEKISDPIQATKRKQAMKNKKKIAKKRKVEEQKHSIKQTTKKTHKIRRLEDLFVK